jgi:TRAP-type C4-dicarboxylate transport system permease small subunit
MKAAYRTTMDGIYLFCMSIAGLSLVIMTLIIPWGVYTRYVLNRGSAWPEPMAVLLVILFTFFAGAACYRAGVHISVGLLADSLSAPRRRIVILVAEGLMTLLAMFMLVWGILLVDTTWYQVIAEFPFLSVGITYMPIPIGAAFTLLFIGERLWIGPTPQGSIVYREPAEAS